jgi:hypothetical protein
MSLFNINHYYYYLKFLFDKSGVSNTSGMVSETGVRIKVILQFQKQYINHNPATLRICLQEFQNQEHLAMCWLPVAPTVRLPTSLQQVRPLQREEDT